MMSIEVVGLGALNMDYIHRVERILTDGEAVVETTLSSPGGSAANTIYGLARLGIATGFIGAVGDDDDGTLLLRDFERVGVDTSQIKVKAGVRTGAVFCLSDQLGQRSLYVIPGANNRLTVGVVDTAYINQARILHISSFAGERQLRTTLELLERVEEPVNISFAPGALYAVRGLDAISPILARTDFLFVNGDEITQLTSQDIAAGAETCLRQGCHLVTVTLGRGMKLPLKQDNRHRKVTAVAYIRDARSEHIVELPDGEAITEVDTTGAGDAFTAGFLYGLLNHKKPRECGQMGHVAARFAIARLGSRQGFPTLAQLSQQYRKLYSK